MGIAAIEAKGVELTPAEAKVASFVLARPRIAAEARLAEFARGAGVSEPTVVRFCQALGFGSFLAFRRSLARDVERRAGSAHAPAPRSAREDGERARTLRSAVAVVREAGGVCMIGPGARDAVARAFGVRLEAMGLAREGGAFVGIGPGPLSAPAAIVVGAMPLARGPSPITLAEPGADALEVAMALGRLVQALRARPVESARRQTWGGAA